MNDIHHVGRRRLRKTEKLEQNSGSLIEFAYDLGECVSM